MKNRFVNRIDRLDRLSEREKSRLQMVADRYCFRASKHYLSLIDWDDPADPIRRLIVPDPEELQPWGRLDASNELNYTVLPGLQHKYNSTALLLVSDTCGGVCRYCFRKRIFIDNESDRLRDIPAALEYIEAHPEITNVLLTGGDPLTRSTAHLVSIIGGLRRIDHVGIIRIGTKMLAFDPYRVVDDPSFREMISRHSHRRKRIYIVVHFNHPREITAVSCRAVEMLQEAGAILVNQTPMIRGVNDNAETLAELFRQLSFMGVPPYYVFQCRPSVGNKTYAVPVEEGYQIFEQAKALVSGLAKRARYVMSHASGKIEIVGMSRSHIYFKYHRAAEDGDSGRFLVCRRNPLAYWYDDYDETVKAYAVNQFLEPEPEERIGSA